MAENFILVVLLKVTMDNIDGRGGCVDVKIAQIEIKYRKYVSKWER